jgi:general secretion pathway protein I
VRAIHAGKRHRGFTLIEVLVALVIVALGMAALLGTLSSAADSTIFLRDKTFAQWVGLNRIAELRLAARPPNLGKSKGESEFAGRRFQWEQEVLESAIPGVLRIDVSVSALEQGRSGAARLATVSGAVGEAIAPPSSPPVSWYGGGPSSAAPNGQGRDGADSADPNNPDSGDANPDDPAPRNPSPVTSPPQPGEPPPGLQGEPPPGDTPPGSPAQPQ